MKRKKILEGAEGFFGGMIKQGGELIKGRDTAKIRVGTGYAATFLLSFLLSMVRAPMGVYPFSYAVVGASSGGMGTLMAFLGAVSGSFTMETGTVSQIIVIAFMILFRLGVCFLKGDFRSRNSVFRRLFRERGYIRVVAAAGGAAAVGCVSILNTESVYYGLFSALLGIGEAAVACASLIFFADRGADRSKRVAGFAVLCLGLSAACDIIGLPFSLSAVLTFFAAVYFSYAGGSYLGVIAGFAGGIALGGEYAVAMGSVGIVSALLWEYSKTGAVVLSALAAAVLSLFSAGLDALSDIIPEIALASAVAVSLINTSIFPRELPLLLTFESRGTFSSEKTKNDKRYSRLGDAMEGLSKMLTEVGDKLRLPTKEEARRIGASARAKYCSGCIHEKDCSGADAHLVESMFSNMEYRLTTNGRISAKIVPEAVARRCYNMDSIIDSMNTQSKRASGLSGAARKSRMYAQDYSAIAGLLKDISEESRQERDTDGERALSKELLAEGFSFDSSSVYGSRIRRVYMRGVDPASSVAGERDIKDCAERVLSARLSSPEFSIDGKYISASMHSLPIIKLTSGRYAVKSDRDDASGDSVCSFENDEGFFYTLVSDGMGSGREAAVTSGISAVFLEKLLVAGCPMKGALELLNCFVRGAEGECFTTVDLMEADLYTGRARFIKSGAAPSFVIRKGQLYRLHSKTVPVGIMRALDAEALSFDLLAGDTVIMVSDGVTGSYEESPWLYDLLSGGLPAGDSPSALSRRIAEEAAKNTGREDDITVCVMKVECA